MLISYAFAHPNFRICGFLLLVLGLSALYCQQAEYSRDFDSARIAMVERQIIARGITDSRVIAAMKKVPRHLFVPENLRHYAYSDGPVPIGYDQTISQPYIVALMTEELRVNPADKVLEVGTGSGYQAAILAEIGCQVYTIEILEPLARSAEQRLKELGYTNVKVKVGDGYLGWPEYAPFNRIIVTCAPKEIPQPLIDQLDDGGIMVIPVGSEGFQYLYRVKKHGGRIETEKITPVSFVPLTGPHAK